MSSDIHSFTFSRDPDANSLAQRVLLAFRKKNFKEAAPLALLLIAKIGASHPEVHALCAMVLSKAGYGEASLTLWDKVVQWQPQRTEWLALALHTAWEQEHVSERGVFFTRQWITLLERVFIAPPPPDILTELTKRGWQGNGSAGIHQGHLRAWLWLPENTSFSIRISAGGPQLALGSIRRMTFAAHTLHLINTAVPQQNTPFFIQITDSEGHPVQGSPIPCSSARCALPKKSRVSPQSNSSQKITVVIPVYGDRRATLSCLASIFASQKSNKTPFFILVMWDQGPDKLLHDVLQRLAAKNKIFLQETPVNMGFLASVNQALACVPAGDILLLNADTLVHGDWIDRMASAIQHPDAGTVTALGSDAELLSYPSPSERGDIRHLWQVRILDEACRRLSEQDALREIPVGVGFCMAIARRALDRLGGFDGYRLFGGYGEEVDFCLRVREDGLKNYAAMNVFVAHLGGRSFGYAKKALAAQNNVALFARYPRYDDDYKTFLREDRLQAIREKISRMACQPLPTKTALQLYPWTAIEHPVVKAEQEKALQHGENWAALFVMPGIGSLHTTCRICSNIPLADMSFTLPRDTAALHTILARCDLRTVRRHGSCTGMDSIAACLDLPEETVPNSDREILPRFIPKDGACFAEPPRRLCEWKGLCRLAREHPGTLFWIYRLEDSWGEAPRPINICALPDLDDLTPLSPSCLLLLAPADSDAVCAWRQWLKQHVHTAVPVCGLFMEAA